MTNMKQTNCCEYCKNTELMMKSNGLEPRLYCNDSNCPCHKSEPIKEEELTRANKKLDKISIEHKMEDGSYVHHYKGQTLCPFCLSQPIKDWEETLDNLLKDTEPFIPDVSIKRFISQNFISKKELERDKRNELTDTLQHFADWLHKKGYIDADYYCEEPKAIDQYLKELK